MQWFFFFLLLFAGYLLARLLWRARRFAWMGIVFLLSLLALTTWEAAQFLSPPVALLTAGFGIVVGAWKFSRPRP